MGRSSRVLVVEKRHLLRLDATADAAGDDAGRLIRRLQLRGHGRHVLLRRRQRQQLRLAQGLCRRHAVNLTPLSHISSSNPRPLAQA